VKLTAAGTIARIVLSCLLFVLLPFGVNAQSEPSIEETTLEEEMTAEEAEFIAWAEEIMQRIEGQSGEVQIPNARVTLNVPEAYLFLDAKSARVVLEEAWGNPPDESVLGMLMDADSTPFDGNAWGAVFTYVEDVYLRRRRLRFR